MFLLLESSIIYMLINNICTILYKDKEVIKCFSTAPWVGQWLYAYHLAAGGLYKDTALVLIQCAHYECM